MRKSGQPSSAGTGSAASVSASSSAVSPSAGAGTAGVSGVNLGALVRIHYSWGDREFFSLTEFAGAGLLRSAKASLDFTPDSIDISDHPTFVWEIM